MKLTSKDIKNIARVALVLVLVVIGIAGNYSIDNTNPDVEGISRGEYLVSDVVDGDTLKVKTGETTETVRLIGIDAPESVHPNKIVECFGLEASARLKELLTNKKITLIADESQDFTDRYGRLLRYVYLGEININQKMIEDGYAYEYTYSKPYKFQANFQAAQQSAEGRGAGLWGGECD